MATDAEGFPCGSVFEAELAEVIPICHTTIAGTRIVGRLTAGYVLQHAWGVTRQEGGSKWRKGPPPRVRTRN